ncbi:hypothetical protein E2P81_ATG09779 [Venturia nashicola]|nr:hypothetical protein E2P81_ATG09779 [Venturia nashicola]
MASQSYYAGGQQQQYPPQAYGPPGGQYPPQQYGQPQYGQPQYPPQQMQYQQGPPPHVCAVASSVRRDANAVPSAANAPRTAVERITSNDLREKRNWNPGLASAT